MIIETSPNVFHGGLGGGGGDCAPETHGTFASLTKYCVCIQEGWEEAIQADLQRC